MDKGEFIREGYSVTPCEGGSWLVTQNNRSHISAGMRAFSNSRDLIDWVSLEHNCLSHPIVSSDTPKEVSA